MCLPIQFPELRLPVGKPNSVLAVRCIGVLVCTTGKLAERNQGGGGAGVQEGVGIGCVFQGGDIQLLNGRHLMCE